MQAKALVGTFYCDCPIYCQTLWFYSFTTTTDHGLSNYPTGKVPITMLKGTSKCEGSKTKQHSVKTPAKAEFPCDKRGRNSGALGGSGPDTYSGMFN